MNEDSLHFDGGQPPSIASFTVTPSSLPLGGGNVTLAWSVSGATGLSVDQGIGDVSGLNSKVVAVTASETFSLTATNAAGHNSEQATVIVASTLSVSGKLLSTDKQPVPGMSVVIPGKGSTYTDANGGFTIPGVVPPYDLWIVDGPGKVVEVYKDLKRADPTLWYVGTIGGAYGATVSGSVSGGSYPEPPNYYTEVAFSSPEASSAIFTNSSGAYVSLSLNWSGSTTISGSLHALQIHASPPGIPIGYGGYGKKDISLSNGASLGSQNISLSAVTTATLSGNVIAPAGYTVIQKTTSLTFGNGEAIDIGNDPSSSSSFSYLSPIIPNSSFVLIGKATKGALSLTGFKPGLAANASGVNLALPSPADQLLPVTGATGITATTAFSWSAFSNGLHLVYFTAGAGKPAYFVFTTGTTTTIPDASIVGLGLPSATVYAWKLYGYGPFASMDAAAANNPSLPDGIYGRSSAEFFLGSFGARTFTTAP